MSAPAASAALRLAAPSPALRVPGGFYAVVLMGFALSLAMSWPRAVVIWQANTFFDTDDAMRLVQVRNWLGGQGWFDLVEHRLHPPAGLLMHWSRVVDVPLGALIRLFGLVASADDAERLARIVFPLLLQVALIAATVGTATLLLGPAAALPSMMLIVLSGFAYEQFPPGRIDHHAPQITLLVAMTGTILSALERTRAARAALSGLCLALSLAISLENLPFAAVIVAILPCAWLRDPLGARASLLWFAGSLAVAVPALFVATIPPARYGVAALDAFSVVHLTAALAGAVALALLAVASRVLSRLWQRGLVLGLLGLAVAGLVLGLFPGCLGGPYADLDPVLKAVWLSHVTEAQSLLAATRLRPDTFTMLFCPLVCGAAAAAAAVWNERGLERLRWGAVLALVLVGLAGTIWEIRVASSAQPLAVLGGAWAVTRAFVLLQRASALVGTLLAAAIVLPFTTVGWAMVPMGEGDAEAAAALQQGLTCRDAAAFAPLARLAPGLIFAPIDDGAHLLVATPHSVIAAPYHRNGAGNRLVIDGFMAVPALAEAIVRGSGARYVAICPGEVQIGILASLAPDGVGAHLLRGDIPPWLTPLGLPGTPYRVFGLRPGR